MKPRQQRAMLMSESAEQTPRLIQTVGRGVSGVWGIDRAEENRVKGTK